MLTLALGIAALAALATRRQRPRAARVRARDRVPPRPAAAGQRARAGGADPGVDRMVRVDLRTVTMTVPPQEIITRDNVPARVAAVCYFRVVDPAAAVTQIEAFAPATSQIAQTTLRSVLGRADLDQLLAERERLNEDLQKIIDEQTEPWGIKVSTVEIKDVEIPEAMQRAMARQAEAERERRAKVISAEGEFQASEKLDRRRRDPRPRAGGAAAALPPDAAGDRRRAELDDRLPAPVDMIKPFLDRAADPGALRNGRAAGDVVARARWAGGPHWPLRASVRTTQPGAVEHG